MLKGLFASVCLLYLGLVGKSALAEPRYYTCGDNGAVTTQDQCPDGSTPFLHLGIPPRAGADLEPDPRPDNRPETTEVGAFYWTDMAPDIVNPGREEQGSVSV
jgi:hypothetical protein